MVSVWPDVSFSSYVFNSFTSHIPGLLFATQVMPNSTYFGNFFNASLFLDDLQKEQTPLCVVHRTSSKFELMLHCNEEVGLSN